MAWPSGRTGLDRVYPVVLIDAINVKIRDGQVANRPIYLALAVTVGRIRKAFADDLLTFGEGE